MRITPGSKALGRIVGFFDEAGVFQVVLLDPFHNIQPSGDFGYRVRTTYIAHCQLTNLIYRLSNFIRSESSYTEEQKEAALAELHGQTIEVVGCALLADLKNETIGIIVRLFAAGIATNMDDILDVGLVELKRLLESPQTGE